MGYVEARIGARAKGAYIWQEFLDTGVKHLPLGSDFPIEKVNPRLGIYAAVTRSRINDTVNTLQCSPTDTHIVVSKPENFKGAGVERIYTRCCLCFFFRWIPRFYHFRQKSRFRHF